MQTIRCSREVQEALANDRPVVALESAVFPAYPGPAGWELVRQSEDLVRRRGAVPATLGIAGGEILVGLEDVDHKEFSEAGERARKVGARDLAACLVDGGFGMTTIGATLAIAKVVGIRFAAASGLGGVHRGYAERPDVSADLSELASAPVLVVTSGVKSFLDVEATAEVLESLAVPTLGWHTDTLPLYFTGHGGPRISARVDEVSEVARIAWHHWHTLGRNGGVLLGQPPRNELADVQDLITQSVRHAEAEGVTGPAITAFVLGELNRASGGRTKEATKQLILGTADLAGQVASAYAQLASRTPR
ncbi:Pseudouridine-5'-phosphate glycosidase [Frankia canadensis]|uniref:Pseudouridine-5'-phosphate glycosidase n=1 Tax=Frankia canadensis TaxID=1836972 RepID=A0A2I2KVR4_9ACTN|nr:pseudouridine-5'-phosphate glycosidase [Frankia canadensis]SNQ49757.1 Pseudouridine-5'-phosphate glycosidase [Frankia canadensis]SOU57047.1 Pseudouridine-5'-phosphate glycosidase [Frankia canadensis]